MFSSASKTMKTMAMMGIEKNNETNENGKFILKNLANFR